MKFLKNIATLSLAASAVTVATVGVAPAQAALVGGAGCQSNASSYSLATIVNNNCSVTIGDKVFSNFVANATTTGVGQISSLENFRFSEVNNGNAGIGFDIFGILESSGGAGVADLGLGYKVSVSTASQYASYFINGAIASITGDTKNGGLVRLLETINPGPGQGELKVNSASDSPLAKLLSFAPTKSIDVSKNISAVSTLLAGSQAHISVFRDVYTQVPTPALLPGLVGMGLAAMRKRKNAQQAAA